MGRFKRGDEHAKVERTFRAIAEAEHEIVEEATERVQSEIPFYAVTPVELMSPVVAASFRRAAAAMYEHRGPTREELDEVASVAEQHAAFGVPLDVMLQARRVAMAAAVERCLEIARGFGVDPTVQLEYVQLLWRRWDLVMVCLANAHRGVDLQRTRHDQDLRAAFVRALLSGSLAAREIQEGASAYGLAAGAKYMPFRARPGSDVPPGLLIEAIESTSAEDGRPSLVAILAGDLAGVVSRPPTADLDGTMAVGPAVALDALEPAFRHASRALDTALAFGLKGVASLDDLSLRPAVVSERYMGDRMVERYLEPLEELGDFGATLETTVREYLRLGTRVDETARALFVHPNTLRHRLERFEQITGADLRCTQNLVELWWALERRQLDWD